MNLKNKIFKRFFKKEKYYVNDDIYDHESFVYEDKENTTKLSSLLENVKSNGKRDEMIYHQLDFSDNTKIILKTDAGDLLVKSKFSLKPPAVPQDLGMNQSLATDEATKPENRTSLVVSSLHNLISNRVKSNSSTSTPLLRKKELKNCSSGNFLKLKKESQEQSIEILGDNEDYMFLDFTKNMKRRNNRRGVNLCRKNSTL